MAVDHEREDQYPVAVKMENPKNAQKEFDFNASHPRSFIPNLPARIDEYEAGVARVFHLKTGMDYYHAIDHIIDFVTNTGRTKIVDLLTDTAAFALRIADRKAFKGHIHSFDSNITLLERAKQRAVQLNLQRTVEFKQSFHESKLPLPDGFANAVVSVFDLQRRPLNQYFTEILRILEPTGLFIIAILTETKTTAPIRFWQWACLKFIYKNPAEAETIYPNREDLIKSLFCAGFRQVILQEMNASTTMRPGVFSLIAATK